MDRSVKNKNVTMWIKKQKDGPHGTIDFTLYGECQVFEEKAPNKLEEDLRNVRNRS